MDEDAALEIAKAYVGPERIESIAPEQGVEGEIPCYGIAVNTTDAGVLHLQVTKTGGHVLDDGAGVLARGDEPQRGTPAGQARSPSCRAGSTARWSPPITR